ncbi:MAG TPA: hypothetical protein PKI76_01865 [Oscillospiraceae bacterium]|nr:hypothetical protein [Oscillospiraceae bacterium]HNW04116.1 hypothetical protein [Oscillospiraceae bacterium]
MALAVLFSLPATAAAEGEGTASGGASQAEETSGGAVVDTRTAFQNAFEEWKLALYIVGFTALSGVTFWSVFLLIENRKEKRCAQRNALEQPDACAAEPGVLKEGGAEDGDAQTEDPGRAAK